LNQQSSFSKQHKIMFIGIILSMILFQYVISPMMGQNKDADMMTQTVLRVLAGFAFIIILTGFGYQGIFRFKEPLKALLMMIPALIISINNFPIIAFCDGRAQLIDPGYRVFLFLMESLSVGFFEEILFRGVILILLIQRYSQQKHGLLISVILSSVLFGMVHLINLWNGASLFDTLLQVGYSTLMGMLWAVMYLRTQNLWLTMILHATYNFFGQVMFYLGTVNGRYDTYTIGITIILGCFVALYAIFCLKETIRIQSASIR